MAPPRHRGAREAALTRPVVAQDPARSARRWRAFLGPCAYQTPPRAPLPGRAPEPSTGPLGPFPGRNVETPAGQPVRRGSLHDSEEESPRAYQTSPICPYPTTYRDARLRVLCVYSARLRGGPPMAKPRNLYVRDRDVE